MRRRSIRAHIRYLLSAQVNKKKVISSCYSDIEREYPDVLTREPDATEHASLGISSVCLLGSKTWIEHTCTMVTTLMDIRGHGFVIVHHS